MLSLLLIALAPPSSALSEAQRAAALLGLTLHEPAPLPKWIRPLPWAWSPLWIKTIEGECLQFEREEGDTYYRRRICEETRPSGEIVWEEAMLEIDLDPQRWHGPAGAGAMLSFRKYPSFYVIPPNSDPNSIGGWSFGGAGSTWGSWIAVSSSEDEVRFEAIGSAGFETVYESRPCDPESLTALRGGPEQELWSKLDVRRGHQSCPVLGGPRFFLIFDYGGSGCAARRETLIEEPVDCRVPCPPLRLYLTEADLDPGPFYRDPDPEAVALYRSEAACLASDLPGLYQPPEPTCSER